MNRRRYLIDHRWHRYLWLEMRTRERYLAHMLKFRTPRCVGWRVAMMKHVDQLWGYLQ